MSHIIIRHIPSDVIFGIDNFSIGLSCQQSNIYVKDISNGIHIIHFQDKVSDLRYGYWVKEIENLYIKYNDINKQFELFSEMDEIKYDSVLKGLETSFPHNVINFPKINENYIIYNYLNWEDICRCLRISSKDDKFGYIDSGMITQDERNLLETQLKKVQNRNCNIAEADVTGRSNNDSQKKQEKIIEYTTINFKSRDSIRRGFEMIDYLDKSYYLNEVLLKRMAHGWYSLLSELQFSFLNFFTVGNYGSSLQWHYIIELVILSSKVDNIGLIDDVVSTQLRILPEEYRDTLLNLEMWARCFSGARYQGRQQLPKTEGEIHKLFPQLREDPVGESSVADEGHDVDDDIAYEINIENSDDSDGPTVVETVSYCT